jgi:hypothetical protein
MQTPLPESDPNSSHSRFIDFAMSEIGFLVEDFGFTATVNNVVGIAVSFAKDALAIESGWYKGEVDLVFLILLENSVFRPYIPRYYNLGEVFRPIGVSPAQSHI